MNQNTFPASAAEISASLQVLFDALPFQRGTRTDNVALAYIEALRGMTLDAINAGIRKFLRGECDDVNPRFIPTPPELARIVRTAVVQHRVSQAVENIKRVTMREIPGERARMKLKMPLFQAAFGRGARMDELVRANESGFEAMVALAVRWGAPVADETMAALNSPNAEQDWRAVRNRAWAAIEANPPPFMRGPQRFQQAAE